MDALTSVVTALAAAAAAALQSTVEQTVKDSYAALKGHIQRQYAQVSADLLAQDRSSEGRRAAERVQARHEEDYRPPVSYPPGPRCGG
jgi:hypothetical protein